MKVSCPSCEAKYNIADEKIKGKKVKVRCKSCGTQILVDGNSSQVSSVAPPDDPNDGGTTQSSSPAALDDSATADAWTVNFSDTDERTLTTAEIAEMAKQGQLPDEVFVWKEGMPDWQLVTSVPELASALAAAKRSAVSAKPSPSQSPGGAASAGSKPSVTGAAGASLGPIVAAPGSALAKKMASAKSAAQKRAAELESSKPESEQTAGHKAATAAGATTAAKPTTEPPPAAKSAPEQSLAPKAATKLAAKRQTGTHDLFAAVDRAGSEIDVDTSDAEHEPVKATGARNENSVLFSLDALKSGMLGGPAATAPTQQSPTGPRRKAPGAPTKRLEELMTVDVPGPTFAGGSLGGGGLLLSGNDALLAAPPPPPPPKPEPKPQPVPSSSVELAAAAPRKSRLGLVIVLAVALVALGAGGAFLALKSTEKPEANAAGTASAIAAASAPVNAAASASAAPSAAAAASAVAQNDVDAGIPSSASSASTQPVAVAVKGGGGASRPVAGKPGAAEPKPTEKKPETKAAEPAAAGAGGFNKEAAVAALSVAASQATVCKRPEGPWGSGRAVVTFASSGRVTTANVTGDPFGGTAVGGCVASVFRRAKIPAFSGDPVTVSKSFTIAP